MSFDTVLTPILQAALTQFDASLTVVQDTLASLNTQLTNLQAVPSYALSSVQQTIDNVESAIAFNELAQTAFQALMDEANAILNATEEQKGLIYSFSLTVVSTHSNKEIAAKMFFNWQSVISDTSLLQLYADTNVPHDSKYAAAEAVFQQIQYHPTYVPYYLNTILTLQL